MSKYRYGGLEPVPDGEGSMVRPGEVREFKTLPGYGPWEPVDGPEPPREAPPRPAPPAPPPAPAAPSSTATPPAAGNGGN